MILPRGTVFYRNKMERGRKKSRGSGSTRGTRRTSTTPVAPRPRRAVQTPARLRRDDQAHAPVRDQSLHDTLHTLQESVARLTAVVADLGAPNADSETTVTSTGPTPPSHTFTGAAQDNGLSTLPVQTHANDEAGCATATAATGLAWPNLVGEGGSLSWSEKRRVWERG